MSEGFKLRAILAALRLSIALFMILWALRKVLDPVAAERVFATFYAVAPGSILVVLFGVAQLLILIAFALGLAKTLSYGAVTVMHAASTLSTSERLVTPYDGSNLLFWAAVPILAALVMLFLFRREDRLLSVG